MGMLIIDDEILLKCIKKWGPDFQVELAIEEIGECIEQLGITLKSFNHFKRGRIDRDKMMEEFADVFLMMQQMRCIDYEKFDKICEYKAMRLLERLEK